MYTTILFTWTVVLLLKAFWLLTIVLFIPKFTKMHMLLKSTNVLCFVKFTEFFLFQFRKVFQSIYIGKSILPKCIVLRIIQREQFILYKLIQPPAIPHSQSRIFGWTYFHRY